MAAMVVAINYGKGKVVLAPIPSAFSQYLITIFNIRPVGISRGKRVKPGVKIGTVKSDKCGEMTFHVSIKEVPSVEGASKPHRD